MLGAAGTLAGVALAGPFAQPQVSAAESKKQDNSPLPAPKPIPGGINIPPLIHTFSPGPLGQVLPYTQSPLQGLDVEPSTITDYNGFTAQSYHVGTATGNDGKAYNLETDIRVFQGQYIASDGSKRAGTFALL